MVNFMLHLYFPRGGWVLTIKFKANLSSTGTGLPIGTELGKNYGYIPSISNPVANFSVFVLINGCG